jgi:hypothetical protein
MSTQPSSRASDDQPAGPLPVRCHSRHSAQRLPQHHPTPHLPQTSPPCLTIEQGIEHVGCIRLSPKGLLRWYATCCNTPLANMLDKPGLPFIGVQRCTLPDDAESILGPSTGIQGRFATGDRSTLQAHNTAPMVVFVRTAYRLGVNVLRGQARPSPFHKPDGSFITTPTVLSKDQRNAARDPT